MKRKILKFISALAALCFVPALAYAQDGEVAEGIVAIVGRQIILKSEVDIQFETISRQAGQSVTKCQVLEDLLFEKLLLHQAEVDSVVVDDGEVDRNIDRRLQQLSAQMGGDNRIEEYYGKSIPEIREEMRPLMRNQLVAQRMQFKITEGLEVTPTEVQQFYNSIPQDSLPLINTEVELAQLAIYPEVDSAAEKAVLEQLKGIKERILGGTSFSTMAVLYSEDPGSNKNGGEYKGIKRGQFVKEFEAVAFNLQAGEISEPVRTVFGWHLIQLQSKRGEELDLRHILIKPKISEENLDAVRSKLDSIRLRILDGEMTFAEAVERYSQDDETRYNSGLTMNPVTGDSKWDLANLDRIAFYAVEALNQGEISRPSLWRDAEQKEAFRLIQVVTLTQPHRANMKDDYARLMNYALQKKQAEAMEKWMKTKKRETFIRVNNQFYNCTFDQDWNNEGKASTNQ